MRHHPGAHPCLPHSPPRPAVASAAFMCVLWALRLQPLPQVSWADIKALAPVSHILHFVSLPCYTAVLYLACACATCKL